MSDGVDLDDFLNGGGGGRAKYLKDWKKEGSIVVCLHCQPSSEKPKIAWRDFKHGFYVNDVRKENGEEVPYLRFTMFSSPDVAKVCDEQHFRDRETGRLRMPPLLDPFLLLREWLREEIEAQRMTTDQVIFEWTDPSKNNALIQWKAGEISRIVKRGQTNWNHSLDAREEYQMVVVSVGDIAAGAQIVRLTAGLAKAIRKAIKNEIESNGRDAGNPLVTPWAMKWIYDKNADINERYNALRFNRQEITEELLEQIQSPDFSEPRTGPRPGDKAKIRAAFEDAAKIDLPYDLLFSPQWKDDDDSGDADEFSDSEDASGAQKSRRHPGQSIDSEPDRPSARDGSPRKRRRKKAATEPAKPSWWVEPGEREACEDCGFEMHPGWAECPGCGAHYDIDGEALKVPEVSELKAAGWPFPEGYDEAMSEETAAPADTASKDADAACYSCGASITGNEKTCPNCGADLGDDIPF